MDFQLTSEQQRLQGLAREFAYRELRPVARALDRQRDPADTFPLALLRRASELGLRTLKIPVEHGGLGADCLTEVLVLEELCAGDAGFGMMIQHAWREGNLLASFTTAEQRLRYLPDQGL